MGPFGPASTCSTRSRRDPRQPVQAAQQLWRCQSRARRRGGVGWEQQVLGEPGLSSSAGAQKKGPDAGGDERLALATSFLPHLALLCASSSDSPPVHAGLC